MKKKLSIIITLIMAVVLCTGCNKQVVDVNYTFNKAVLVLGDEVKEIEISSWTDYEDGEQIQIKAKDGTVYLTNSMNCTLIKEK